MEILERRGAAWVLLDGELDHHLSAMLRPRIDGYIAAHRPSRLVLDFTAVSFMDSSAVGLVLGRWKMLVQSGGELVLTGLSPQQLKVMKLAGVGRLARICEENGGDKNDGKPNETDTAV